MQFTVYGWYVNRLLLSAGLERRCAINRKHALICCALVVAAVLLLYSRQISLLEKFALEFEDLKFGVRQSLDLEPEGRSDVVIVAVDERAINAMGRFPWPRQVVGDLLTRLKEAELVGLDIIFAEPSEADQDAYLAATMAGANNVVAGFFFRAEASERLSAERFEALKKCAYTDVETKGTAVGVGHYPFAEVNIDLIAEAAVTCAFFNNEADADGQYRKYPLTYIHEGFFFPSLAVQMLRWHLNKEARLVVDGQGVRSFGLGDVALKDQNRFLFNYPRLRQETFVSAVDVYTGKIAPDFFRGKIVLLGVTEMGLFDLRPTPVDPATPGVWLHYVALSNLLDNNMLRPSKAGDVLLIVIPLLMITGVSLIRALWLRRFLYVAVIFLAVFSSNALFIMHNVWLREFYPFVGCLILSMVLEIMAFVQTELRAGELKKAFTSYVSPEVVSEILKHPEQLELGGSERLITVLFSDIRGFTSISEKMTPKELVRMLNQIHDPLTHVILRNRGLLDKYIGDAMMALFNAPLDVDRHADLAVQSALEMVDALVEINRKLQGQGGPAINIGIGINTGACVVGNIGSTVRMEYTAIGDAVNLASRLEGLCKTYGCRIIISDSTRDALVGEYLLRKLDLVRVKGRNRPLAIFEVMADNPANRLIQTRFEEGLARYFAGDFAEAGARFGQLAGESGDPTAAMFANRCEIFQKEPPPADWDGVFSLTSK